MEDHVPEPQLEEDVPEPQMEHADDAGFPGGPMLRHVLTQYEHHVARRLWEGEDRGPLKVITHGLKLKKFSEVPVPHPVERWIRESGLLPLSSAYLTMVDAGLVSAFIERWHRETSSFHLPFGEMTITLDDVATLLHISPNGKFFDAPVNMSTNNAARAAHEYLGATWEESLAEINFNKCAQYRLQWLRDLYSRLIQTNQFECAARAYLLHLVGSTIFADKTHTRVEAKYISLFIDLARCRHYSWAAAALVFETFKYFSNQDSLTAWVYDPTSSKATYTGRVVRTSRKVGAVFLVKLTREKINFRVPSELVLGMSGAWEDAKNSSVRVETEANVGAEDTMVELGTGEKDKGPMPVEREIVGPSRRTESELPFPVNDPLPTVTELLDCFEILAPPKPPISWVDLTSGEIDPSIDVDEEEATSKMDATSYKTCGVCGDHSCYCSC
uniref:Uncharacterized protein LOC105852157 n=1 Tax=Cicer arietinum TaxID=3827 RepID=A0A1S3E656_CICAR|nr:uncharacterized protein LOC105852157 [Cicer arietinum]